MAGVHTPAIIFYLFENIYNDNNYYNGNNI